MFSVAVLNAHDDHCSCCRKEFHLEVAIWIRFSAYIACGLLICILISRSDCKQSIVLSFKKQRSARLGFHSRDRYRDFLFLGLRFETETETQILKSRDREFDETFFLTFSRPRLRPRLGWVSKSRLFETETETFSLWLLIRCLGRNFNLLRQVETYP